METTGERRGQPCVGLLVLGQQRKRWLCQWVRRHGDCRRVPWDCRASGVVWQLPTLELLRVNWSCRMLGRRRYVDARWTECRRSNTLRRRCCAV